MKKLLTLAFALAALAVFAGLSVGQGAQQNDKHRKSHLSGKVLAVNEKDKTFAVDVNFSAKEMKTLPAVGEVIDVTYTETPGGPMATPSCCTGSSKSNGSERLVSGRYWVTGKVTKVNPKNNTFAVEVTVSAKNLKAPLPEVGKIIDVTFTQPTPGGPLEASNLNLSKSNIN